MKLAGRQEVVEGDHGVADHTYVKAAWMIWNCGWVPVCACKKRRAARFSAVFIYKRNISRGEESLWEERLNVACPLSVVVTRLAGSSLLEATFGTAAEALVMQAAFGGEVSPLVSMGSSDGWEPLPLMVGRRFVLEERDSGERMAASQTPADGRITLRFSTPRGVFEGHRHPSTLLTLRMILDLVEENRLPPAFDCIDAGCGSGILGIAASLLGAGKVTGVDHSEEAVRAARKHSQETAGDENRHWLVADLVTWQPERPVALVAANLYADLLEGVLPRIQRWVMPGGWLIASGILERLADPVFHVIAKEHMVLMERRQRGPWLSLLLRPQLEADRSPGEQELEGSKSD